MVDMKTIGGQGLLSEVGAFLQRSSDVQFGRVQTVGRQSTVDVIYRLPNSNTLAAIRFVVQKDDLTWRINATQTIDLQNAMYDFS